MNNPTYTTHSDFSLSGLDLFLALLGLVGVVLFGLFLPSEHPDSTAVFEITETQAVQISSDFLQEQGLILEGLLTDASLQRRTKLLLNLQHALNRETAVEFLESENRNQITAYYWKVQFRIPKDPETSSFVGDPQLIYEVELAQNGDVIAFQELARSLGLEGRRYGNPREKVNRDVLFEVFYPDSSNSSEIFSTLKSLPDSVFAKSLRFDLRNRFRRGPSDFSSALQADRVFPVDSSAIRRIARYHIARTSFRDLEMMPDSLVISESAGISVAKVNFRAAQPIAGQEVKLVVTIPATGTLAGLELEYEAEESPVSKIAQIFDFLGAGMITLLSLVFIVVFFRRMIARLLDIKSAMIDAMVLGLTTGSIAVLVSTDISLAINSAPLWGAILLNLLIFSFTAGGVAVFAFMVAGVTDSVVREHDEGKLRTLTLFRHGEVVNRPLGASLVRGTALAGAILGLSVFCLSILPDLSLEFSERLAADSSIRPFVSTLFSSFSSAYFYVLLWIVGISTVAFKRSKRSWLAVLLIIVTGSVMDVGPFAVESGYTGIIVSAVFSLILALAYVRFDILTVLVAMFMSKMLWNLSDGFLVTGSTSWIDLTLAVLFILTVLILGTYGVLSKRTGQEADTYVPGYVTEMAGQERVKRELEIAQQVQTFFLPGKMPIVENLEIAGMCLPATEVGGDYYDFIELSDGRMAFILGDVSGKGIQAAFFMTLVKGIIQTLSRQGLEAADVMRKLNHLFCMNAPAGTFISVIYGEFNPADNSFTFSRAGHNPAILWEAETGTTTALQPKGMAIGFSDGIRFDSNIEQVTVNLKAGDSMVFYTDGFSEAMNRKRDLYGDDRLLDKVAHFGGRSASAIMRLMTEDVHHFIEGMGRADDMTMVVFRVKSKDASHA